MATSMTKVTSSLAIQAIILVMTIMVLGMEVEAIATKSSINMISASPAVLPYPTTTPSDSTSSASPAISSFFPKANSPSGQAESPYGPNVMAYGPAPSSGEIIGRASSSTSHSASLNLCYIVVAFLHLVLALFFVTK